MSDIQNQILELRDSLDAIRGHHADFVMTLRARMVRAADLIDQGHADVAADMLRREADALAVTQRLRRQAPVMRKAGWTVQDDGGDNHQNVIRWSISPPRRPEKACNSDSQSSQTRGNGVGCEDARVARHEYGPSQDDYVPDCPRCDGEGCRWCREVVS